MDSKKVSVDQAYDSPPWWYDVRGLMILWLTYKSSLRRQVWFFSDLQSSDTHLEVAIGSGSLFRLVSWACKMRGYLPKKIIGFDYAPSMLAGAQKTFGKVPNIELHIADATSLPFQDKTFTSVNIANALHSIPNYPKALHEISRVMQKGGQLKLNALLYPSGFLKNISEKINNWGIKKGILVSPIAEPELLQNLNKSGFIISQIEKHGNCLYISASKKGS